MSHYVYLEVTEPRTSILGGPDIYLSEGDTLNITCLTESPQHISWYRGAYHSESTSRGVISQITKKGDSSTASYFLVHKARLADSGQYSCRPDQTGNSASVSVHVQAITSKDPANWTVSRSTGAQLQSIGILFLYIFVTTFSPTCLTFM
eukprot:GFUD01090696.1.p1 GENE.GFUD01090696.1~~GFUD01090696.1.p1  ORF type:complete len:149 (-),score=18.68 GFUD01090696.1:243-689(-)